MKSHLKLPGPEKQKRGKTPEEQHWNVVLKNDSTLKARKRKSFGHPKKSKSLGEKLRLSADCSAATLYAGKKWSDIVNVMKERKYDFIVLSNQMARKVAILQTNGHKHERTQNIFLTRPSWGIYDITSFMWPEGQERRCPEDRGLGIPGLRKWSYQWKTKVISKNPVILNLNWKYQYQPIMHFISESFLAVSTKRPRNHNETIGMNTQVPRLWSLNTESC